MGAGRVSKFLEIGGGWAPWGCVGRGTYAKLLQSSVPTLCNPMGCSPPGPYVHGILQARKLLPTSRGSSWPRDRTCNLLSLLHWQVGSLPLMPPGKPPLRIHDLFRGRWPVLKQNEASESFFFHTAVIFKLGSKCLRTFQGLYGHR